MMTSKHFSPLHQHLPQIHVLCKIWAPVTPTGQSYQISAEDLTAVEAAYIRGANKMSLVQCLESWIQTTVRSLIK